MNRSQIPSIKEQLAETERAIRQMWSQLGASDQSEQQRKILFEQIAKLEETADDLRHKINLSLIRDT